MRRSVLVILISLLSMNGKAEVHPWVERTLSGDSRYAQDAYSNAAMANFGVEALGIHTLVFDSIARVTTLDSVSFLRALWAIPWYPLMRYIPSNHAWFLAFHEFGHGTRLASLGSFPSYDFKGGKRYENFFEYYITALGRPTSGGSTGGSGERFLVNAALEYEFGWQIPAGGVNNEVYFSNVLEEKMYTQGNHFLELPFYVEGKLAIQQYVDRDQSGNGGGDMSAMIRGYQNSGFAVSYGDLRARSYICLGLSASTYSYLWGLVNYIARGDSVVRSLEVGSIRLPDFNQYLNANGPTMQVSSGYRVHKNLVIPFGFETVVKGRYQSDFSFGIEGKMNRFGYSVKPIIGNGASILLSGSYDLKSLRLMLGANIYNTQTLYGERHTLSLESEISSELWVRGSLVF